MQVDWGITLGAIGVAIGVLALAMSVSPFSQMIWGRPKLKFEFVEFTGTEGKNLICSIQNEPVKNRFLKFIRVSRDTGNVNASFSVVEQGTGKNIATAISALINDAAAREMALVVSARPHFHVGFPVIHCTKNGPIVFDPRREEAIPVPTGNFIAHILIVCGDSTHILHKMMSVHPDPTRTFWV